jgi:hypothetical protein
VRSWILALADAVRLVVIPGAGVWGMVHDRPLTPLTAGAYLVMMGLAPVSILDFKRERRGSTDAGDDTPQASREPGR